MHHIMDEPYDQNFANYAGPERKQISHSTPAYYQQHYRRPPNNNNWRIGGTPHSWKHPRTQFQTPYINSGMCKTCHQPCAPHLTECSRCKIRNTPVHMCPQIGCHNTCRGRQCRECHIKLHKCLSCKQFARLRGYQYCMQCLNTNNHPPFFDQPQSWQSSVHHPRRDPNPPFVPLNSSSNYPQDHYSTARFNRQSQTHHYEQHRRDRNHRHYRTEHQQRRQQQQQHTPRRILSRVASVTNSRNSTDSPSRSRSNRTSPPKLILDDYDQDQQEESDENSENSAGKSVTPRVYDDDDEDDDGNEEDETRRIGTRTNSSDNDDDHSESPRAKKRRRQK